MGNDLISIVIPVYNRAHCISRTLESCINQTYKNIEIIVCDDHSTDETVAVVKKYCDIDTRIKLVENNLGKGAQYARECAIRNASGKYIAFMDSDDVLLSDSVEFRYSCFCEHDCDMVYGDILVEQRNPLENVLVKYDNLNSFSYDEKKKYLLEELSLCAFITIMIRKDLFDKNILVLDKSLPAWQDDDLVMAVTLYHGAIYHCGQPVAMICTSGDNISAHYINQYNGLIKLFAKYKDEIIKMSKTRYVLWKMRIHMALCGTKMQAYQKENRKFLAFIFFILRQGDRFILSKCYRHIWGG